MGEGREAVLSIVKKSGISEMHKTVWQHCSDTPTHTREYTEKACSRVKKTNKLENFPNFFSDRDENQQFPTTKQKFFPK